MHSAFPTYCEQYENPSGLSTLNIFFFQTTSGTNHIGALNTCFFAHAIRCVPQCSSNAGTVIIFVNWTISRPESICWIRLIYLAKSSLFSGIEQFLIVWNPQGISFFFSWSITLTERPLLYFGPYCFRQLKTFKVIFGLCSIYCTIAKTYRYAFFIVLMYLSNFSKSWELQIFFGDAEFTFRKDLVRNFLSKMAEGQTNPWITVFWPSLTLTTQLFSFSISFFLIILLKNLNISKSSAPFSWCLKWELLRKSCKKKFFWRQEDQLWGYRYI